MRQTALKDLDWMERGRFRRASNYYRTALVSISKATMVPADRLREMALQALWRGKHKYKAPKKAKP